MNKFLVVILLCITSMTAALGQTITWRCTTAANPWVDKGEVTQVIGPISGVMTIGVDPSTTYQTIDGWGGCFNELGWDALSSLTPSDRNAVMGSLFDPVNGCKFNICRMPIGASDFAMSYYSLDDVAGDYGMKKFSDDRDKQKLIPFIKAAMGFQPKLAVWGSPWTPPSWMKTNHDYTGGNMIQTPQNLSAYALYLSKAVKAYQKQGLDFTFICPQNEAIYNNGVYPQCAWTGAQLRDFVKLYLGPEFKKDRVNAQIWAGTFPTGDWDGYPGVMLADPDVRSEIKGMGFQYGGQDMIQRTYTTYPDIHLMETEMECGDDTNTWSYGEYTFELMKRDLKQGVGSFMQWNMILDQTGTSSWGWAQNSMINIDKNTKAVTYNPQFYAAKHFSYYVVTGAKRIAATGTQNDCVAFQNPNGDIVIEVKNAHRFDKQVQINIGAVEIAPTLPAHSISTFVESDNMP